MSPVTTSADTTVAPADSEVVTAMAEGPADETFVEDELLVEEISIDGMCGVY